MKRCEHSFYHDTDSDVLCCRRCPVTISGPLLREAQRDIDRDENYTLMNHIVNDLRKIGVRER